MRHGVPRAADGPGTRGRYRGPADQAAPARPVQDGAQAAGTEDVIDGERRISRRAFGIGTAGAAAAAVGVVVVLAGDGLDPSGAGDSAAAIQNKIDAAPDGALISVPAGAVLTSTATITLSGTGKSLIGPGELRFSDLTDGVALRVTGPGSRVEMVTVTNPEETLERGIEIAAHDVTVTDCVVDRFRYGIVVAAEGEWLNARIINNRVTNVVGAGGGRGSDSRDGEDRGDGITVWGAQATVVGNIVYAKPGTDARIGIHAEGLGDVKVTATPHSESMVTISGNVVTGGFRRCIVFEEISNGTIVGNTVADATWWALALIGGTGCIVADNTVRYTRAAEDDQGSAYSPVRSAVLVYGGTGHSVAGNTVAVSGVADSFVTVYTLDGERPTDVRIAGNNCRTTGDGRCDTGISMAGSPGPVRPKLQGNTVVGMTDQGIYLGEATGAEVSGNTVIGGKGCQRGVFGDNPANSGVLVLGNRVVGCTAGIALYSQTAGVVSANVVEDCGTAIDLFTSKGVVLVGNVAVGADTDVDNLGSNSLVD